MNYQTYKTKVELDKGPFVGTANQVTQPAGYVSGLPGRIWAADSFEWILDVYEASGEKLDMGSGTAKLYIAPAALGASLTEIGTGAISGTGNYIATFTVAADAIPSTCYGQPCVVVAAITASGKQTSVVQYLQVEHYTTGTISALASNISYTPNAGADWDNPDPDDVAEALDDAALRLRDVEDQLDAAAGAPHAVETNTDVDTGTEVIAQHAYDGTCSVVWLASIYQSSTNSMRTMLVIAHVVKSAGPVYTVEYAEGPGVDDIGTVPAGGMFSVTYNGTSKALELKATVATNNWSARAQALSVQEF